MPAKNSIKQYKPNAYYHVYNRGVEKRTVFLDEQDFRFFTSLMRKYLDESYTSPPGSILRPSYASKIHLLAYCLMPTHFHLLVYQLEDEKALEKLFRSLMTGYVMYFNKKYSRSGPLFQGRYKANLINSDSYLHHISRYIHLNPIDAKLSYDQYPYSSYQFYKHSQTQSFVKTEAILSLFPKLSYTEFVSDYVDLFVARTKESDFDYPSGLS